MNQTFYTPINEPYHQHHYTYLPTSTINGQKNKKGNNTPTTSSPNNNTNNQDNNTLPSFVKTTSALLDCDRQQQQQNNNTASSYLYNNHGIYNEAPSPSVHHQQQQDNNILPPLSSLLPPAVDINSTTKYSSNYPHPLNNMNMSFVPPNVSSPFNSSRPHDIYQPISSPVSNASRSTTESLSRRNSISSSATSSLDTPENQKRIFQTMISRVMIKENKKVVKINQQQQSSLLMKVLKFNQLKLAQMMAQSNRSHHTISAQLLDNGGKLDVYVLARRKNIGVNSVSNMERRVDCFKLDDYSFNIVVLEPNH
ncbi:predicted protein [Naegleria gruberi]|uniref:Predicted protein n=1 Tax=Naegleria gruberi TaxID=5762 RepID=D2V6M5_NAEGR|nr:uncharacterized protein NAEGRDRAFT_57304 [Naegleria gruberi]EFC47466.1 predicted protein [Naegleria gruberi]|eukprot:XP_002680210.1 predicted protein [Naegleria gruberi strain NEG-M]